jgi:O-antigen ligase
MSTLSVTVPPIHRMPAAAFAGVAALLALATIGAAYVSIPGFLLLAAATLGAAAIAALRWPRAMLVAVVIAPILDRFLIARFMPDSVARFTQFFSETLLAVVGVALLIEGVRRGRVLGAFRHQATVAIAAFLLVAGIATLLNRVPPVVAGAGLFYTFDAVALFYLCRIVGFDRGQAFRAIAAVVLAVAIMALVAFLQALLDPNLLGLSVVTGRSGESVRIGSLVKNPNAFGTLVGLVLPFALFAAVDLRQRRWRAAALGVSLLLATGLLLTYSRGSWLGVVAGTGVVLLLLDRRVFVAALIVAIAGLGIATYMPRDLMAGSSAGPHQPAQFDAWGTTEERVSAVGEGRDLRTMFVLNALPILRDHPIFGVGPGRYGGAVAYDLNTPIYTEYDTQKLLSAQTTVDNFWLHILIEGGVLGAAAFVALLGMIAFGLARTALRSRHIVRILAGGALAGAAMVVVSNATTMLLEANTVAFMFWFVLGVASVLSEASDEPEAASV